ncbi:DNA glycosylase AlkZ-like family protein [Mycetocola tolaasinivorans]|uniref:DNA glycosylase AlkZ-like family protein n=1 Tax=Mycetocola tolaasinivorans TaxID=76635 RepID=UPI0015FF392C|nr:crosslink repair DNA glycosylase YcaQ family protein [Mycetocola tolaasinivorans]
MSLHNPTRPPISLSALEARRIAAAASLVPAGATTPQSILTRVGLIQLDALARVDRAHRLTGLARLPGNARAPEIDATLWSRGEAVSFETHTHAAALIPVEDWPLFRLNRMSATQRRDAPSAAELEGVTALIRESNHGLTLARIEETAPRSGGRWDWSECKRITEHLVWRGDIVSTDRRLNRRIYDVPERRIPEPLLNRTLSRSQILIGLANRAIDALGVATASDVAHYYNLTPADAAYGLEHGHAIPTRVEGWSAPTWTSPVSELLTTPQSPDPRLIGPFDPLIRDRDRARRVFNFDYTFEAYKPAAKRIYGHYVLGVILGSEFIGRADVRREGRTLIVNALFPEPGTNAAHFRAAASAAAETLASQLALTTSVRC